MRDEPASPRSTGETDGAAPSARYSDEQVAGLACHVGRARVAVPLDAVRQVVECEVANLAPLTNRFVGGLGLHDGRAIVSIRLSPDGGSSPEARPARRTIQAILLGHPGAGIDWALEVDRVAGLVQARLSLDRRGDRSGKLPRWVLRAKDASGHKLAWIDVDGMVNDLSSGARR